MFFHVYSPMGYIPVFCSLHTEKSCIIWSQVENIENIESINSTDAQYWDMDPNS